MPQYLIYIAIAFAFFCLGFILACILSASRISEAESNALHWKIAYKDLLKRLPDKILTRLRIERIGRL
jgi:hypothetical protein